MPRECSVCSHPEAFAINEALILQKASNRRIAPQYGLSEKAIRRHGEHIPQLLVKAAEERHEHLAAFNRLAADRYALEEEAEAQMAALLNTLHVRQRQQGTRAGRPNAHGEHPIRFLLADWLVARLGGVEGYLDSSISPTFAERALPELDGLAQAPHAGVDKEE